ncbi:MAG: hypothetical protein K2R98_18100 [Gemmataceae bacterium]|nr:hypothetical protein [Gemmataceae bacterium]
MSTASETQVVPTIAPAVTPPAPPRRRWHRRLAIALALALLLAIFHDPLLRLVADGLIVNADPLAKTDAVVFDGAYGPFSPVPLDEVAALYRDGYAAKVVFIEDRSSRLAQMGITPTLESVVRRELASRGVPNNALTALAITTSATRAWDGARFLRDWLRANPALHVTFLCDEFGSRRGAYVLRQVCAPDEFARLRWHVLPDRRYDRTNWWRNRQGLVNVPGEYIAFAALLLRGEEDLPERWDADQYEQELNHGLHR